MADLSITPVATQVKPVPGMSAADMLNMITGVQAYRSGQIALSKQEQENTERLALQDFFSKPENFQTDGRIDMSKVAAAVPKLAPLTGRTIMSEINSLTQTETAALSAKQNLTQTQRQIIAQRLSALGRAGIQDPSAYVAELDVLASEMPDNAPFTKLVEAYKQQLSTTPPGQHVPQMVIRGAQSFMSPTEQETQFGPQVSMLPTGAGFQPMVTQKPTGGAAPTVQPGGGQFIPQMLGPEAQYQATGRMDINNNPTYYVRDPKTGRFLGEYAIPAGQGQPPGAPTMAPTPAAPAMPTVAPEGPPAVQRLRPGETPETLQAANQFRVATNTAAAEVPNQRFTSNQIIKLADEISTGAGAETLAKYTGGLSILQQFGVGGDMATKLQSLGHYMSQQTASLSQSSGLSGTDAARSIAGDIAGKSDWTADAIKSTARVNRMFATATELFNQGMNAAFDKKKDPFAVMDFRNKWAQTVDLEAMRLYDAANNGDTEAMQQIISAAGGVKSARYKQLLDGYKRIRQLALGRD